MHYLLSFILVFIHCIFTNAWFKISLNLSIVYLVSLNFKWIQTPPSMLSRTHLILLKAQRECVDLTESQTLINEIIKLTPLVDVILFGYCPRSSNVITHRLERVVVCNGDFDNGFLEIPLLPLENVWFVGGSICPIGLPLVHLLFYG